MSPRLKSLELHGYKTFASRTRFEFPGLITAIVGPNGSGKSNVADSLRWVLGEQSYSLLRARRTEDMIFSGSDARPRAGMASATITFDNEDGWLPIDFSEVSITRRAYRDGQNEYLLNGQRVRLREISELLAKSGLAERTYTIIGQGLVDAALSLKPEERRRLFEEAAGISLYRSRREEAINRLEDSKRNLERVKDILSEIEPRLRNLEKQAKRVQEYERIQADLRLLLREWYGYHWHRSQRELTRTQEILHQQQTRLEKVRSRYDEVNASLAGSRTKVQELRSTLNTWHAEASHLHTQQEKASRELAILDEREQSFTRQRRNYLGDLERLDEELAQVKAQMETIQAEKDQAAQECSEAKEELSLAQNRLKERQVEQAQAEKAYAAARQKLTALETSKVQLHAHQGELSSRLETLDRSLQGSLAASQQEKTELTKAKSRLDETSTARSEAQANFAKAEAAVREDEKKIRGAEEQAKKSSDELYKAGAEIERIRLQIDVLEDAEKSLAGFAGGAKHFIELVRSKKLPGKFALLAQQMVVPAEYETAIGAALGDFIDAIYLDGGADAESALGLLEKSSKGKTAIVPSGWLKKAVELTPPDDPDCLGVAARLVKVDAEYRNVMDVLLGSVLIVKDRRAARNLADGLPAHARMVTLAGEVFLSNGPILAGQEVRSVKLSRPRQKSELADILENLEARRKDLQELDRRASTHLQKARSSAEGRRQEFDQVRKLNEEVNSAFQKAQAYFDQVRRQVDWQESQSALLKSQVESARADLGKMEEELTQVDGRLAAAGDEVQQCRQSLNTLSVDEPQAQVTHWNMTSALADRSLKEVAKRYDERQETHSVNSTRKADLHNRLAALERDLSDLDQQKGGYRTEEARISGLVGALQQEIEPAEKELESAETTYGKLQDDEVAAHQAMTVVERHHAQAELDFSRQQEALESLQRRVEDDFGLVSYQYAENVSGPTPLPLDGMVEQLPMIAELHPEIEGNITRQRAQLRRMGAVNLEAHAEYLEVHERYKFLTSQLEDLRKANTNLAEVIAELDQLMRKEFKRTFDAVAKEFTVIFTRLFAGGNARLVLIEADDPTEIGIDIEARLPGRKEQGLALLSGGERSLTAVALVFSLLKISPTPFAVLDEVDAMLDESNVGRFRELLKELSLTTQFLVITHNRNTVQASDVIYGVTMGRDSASQVISLKMDEISDEMIASS